MEFVNAGPTLTEQDLRDLEAEIGPLRPELRKHYLSVNGGRPEARRFEDDTGDEFDVHYFLSVRYRRDEDELLLEDYYRMFVLERGDLPREYIPFAGDQGGNLFVMQRDTGEIYWWAHDDPEEELQQVAASLSELLHKLHK